MATGVTCADAIERVFRDERGSLTAPQVIERVRELYPDHTWKNNTIGHHLIGMSLNHTSAHHLPNLAARAFLHWTPGGHYRRWDPQRDGLAASAAPEPAGRPVPSARPAPSAVRKPSVMHAEPPRPPIGGPPEPIPAATQPPRPPLKPWVAGPAAMLDHSRHSIAENSGGSLRSAFIEIDNAVELLLRGYLTQPSGPGIRAAQATAQGHPSFPAMLQAVRQIAGSAVPRDVTDGILLYHNQRNVLVHQGSGLTATRESTEAYSRLAVALLRALNESPPLVRR